VKEVFYMVMTSTTTHQAPAQQEHQHQPGEARPEASPLDIVEEASQESFPASDPPEWTPLTAIGPPAHPEGLATAEMANQQPQDHRTDGGARQTRAEHDALLDAMHGLEAALASPAPGREKEWTRRVLHHLHAVADVLARHVASAEARDGLLVTIDQTRPSLVHRVARLRNEHGDLKQRVWALQIYIEHHGEEEVPSFSEIRHLAAWLLNALRHHLAVEADLIFESLGTDIGVSD
jgi:hemerythrin-like domain-containing protein